MAQRQQEEFVRSIQPKGVFQRIFTVTLALVVVSVWGPFYHAAFTASWKNEMAVNVLSGEKQRHKRSQSLYRVWVMTYSLSE